MKTGKKIASYILISFGLGILLTGLGLLDVHFYMAPYSEEAGMLGRGFPHTIIESGPFYAGYVGRLVKEGGREYYLNAPGAFSDPHLSVPGIISNIITYTSFGFLLVIIGKYRKNIFERIRELYTKKGFVLSSLLLTLFGILFLILIFIAFYFIMMIHTAFMFMSGPY